jgi:DNA-binding NarL/FixJ family response regulator
MDRHTEQRPDPPEIRVVLVDDHAIFRNGLRELLQERGIDVVAEASDGEGDVERAIVAGACGYVLKDAAVEEIVAGIRAAAAGDALLSPRIAAGILERARANAPASLPDSARAELTEREGEVLGLMAEGKENAEIAEELFISPHTVKNHVSNILGKLESETRIEAAVKAARGRLL